MSGRRHLAVLALATIFLLYGAFSRRWFVGTHDGAVSGVGLRGAEVCSADECKPMHLSPVPHEWLVGIVSLVGFGLAILSGTATAGLFILRSRQPPLTELARVVELALVPLVALGGLLCLATAFAFTVLAPHALTEQGAAAGDGLVLFVAGGVLAILSGATAVDAPAPR